MKNLTEQDYINIKRMILNLIDEEIFPTRTIGQKNMPKFNEEVTKVINYIEFKIKNLYMVK